ncbi:MAG: DUF2157 domain-containing protein [Bacteroidota bacterium]
MGIQKDIRELVNTNVISEEIAEDISAYYSQKKSEPNNRLFVVFGILGATLVGLGIILIIAHNWDDLSRRTKTVFAFLPLVTGQLLCAYVILKRQDQVTWREGSGAFLVFAIGASISLVSQIYNIPGDLSSFMLTWMLLAAPLIYVLRSSIVSLLYISGITYYVAETAYWTYPFSEPWAYWGLLVFMLPYYYQLFKRTPDSNFTLFHHWLIPLSLTITLGSIEVKHDDLLFVTYMSLFGLFYAIGHSVYFKDRSTRSNGYKIIGSLGTAGILLTLSFNELWKDVFRTPLAENAWFSPEFLATVLLALLAITMIWHNYQKDKTVKPISFTFLVFAFIFSIGRYNVMAAFLVNLLVFAMGILTVLEGAKKDNLGILNYGLLIITALVMCRFFDTNISFVLRGLLFVGVGIAFFMTNMWILKKRRANDQ